MDASTLAKLWTALGAILAYYSANAWLQDRGAGLLFKALLIDNRLVPNAYFSVIIIGLLLTVTSILGVAYARLHPSANWAGRVPIVFVKRLDFDSRAARTYQAAILFAFVVLPATCLVHMCNQLYKYGALFPDATVTRATSDACPSGVQFSRTKACAPEAFRLKGSGMLAAAIHTGPERCIMAWHGGYRGLLDRFAAQGAATKAARTESKEDLPTHNACRDNDKLSWTGGVTWVPIVSPLVMVSLAMLAACSVLSFVLCLIRRANDSDDECTTPPQSPLQEE